LTQFLVESSWIELKICSIQLKSSWKCEQFNFKSSWIQNVNSKLDLMISLFSMFFTFHSSSSFITIKSDDSFRCSFKKFFKFSHSRFKMNFQWIFIVDDNFSQYAYSISIRILKDSSILSFNFFHYLVILMFLKSRNIMSFIL